MYENFLITIDTFQSRKSFVDKIELFKKDLPNVGHYVNHLTEYQSILQDKH